MSNTLFLRLEGPLQSWGERSHWGERDSAPEPTKSGVVGLLACALGWRVDEALRSLSQAVRLGVRCDQPGTRLVDYHTVSGGVMSAQGKVKRNAKTGEPETVVSHRVYLCDASFLVVLQSAPERIAQLAEAIRSPHWPVYLGRKSCPPSQPLYEGEGRFGSLQEALAAWPLRFREGGEVVKVRAVLESSVEEGVLRRDELWSRRWRTFGPRYTRDMELELITTPEEA